MRLGEAGTGGARPSGAAPSGRWERVTNRWRAGGLLIAAAVALSSCGVGAEDAFVPVGSEVGSPTPTTAAPPTTLPAMTPFAAGWFTIALPGQATVDKETAQTAAGPAEVTIAHVAGSDWGYSVAYSTIPGSSFDLNGAAQGAASGVQGRLTDLSPVTYKGNKGLDYRVADAKGGKITVFARVIQVKKRYLQVQAAFEGRLDVPPNDLYRQVLESLTFT